MSVAAVLQMILWLAPHVSHEDARLYAREVADASACYKTDSFDVLAIIKKESNFHPRLRSDTDDYGLMMLHVSRSTRPEYLGLEHLLYEVIFNMFGLQTEETGNHL